MDTTTLAILGVIALFVIIALVTLGGRSSRVSRPTLGPLTPEAQYRFATRWDQVESRFVETPKEAVGEADALVLALLSERQHPLAENRLPNGVRKARREAVRGSMEGLRVAMLEYRGVVEEMLRPPADRVRIREGRRETA